MLKQYVAHQITTLHRLMSIETVAVIDEADEADEYSLEDCTFLSTLGTETYKEVSISNELTPCMLYIFMKTQRVVKSNIVRLSV